MKVDLASLAENYTAELIKKLSKMKEYSLNNNFDSVLDAAKSVNDSSTNISRVCKNNSKVSIPRYLCKKYCFMYENDFNRTLNE